jgi:hypothetical protein
MCARSLCWWGTTPMPGKPHLLLSQPAQWLTEAPRMRMRKRMLMMMMMMCLPPCQPPRGGPREGPDRQARQALGRP